LEILRPALRRPVRRVAPACARARARLAGAHPPWNAARRTATPCKPCAASGRLTVSGREMHPPGWLGSASWGARRLRIRSVSHVAGRGFARPHSGDRASGRSTTSEARMPARSRVERPATFSKRFGVALRLSSQTHEGSAEISALAHGLHGASLAFSWNQTNVVLQPSAHAMRASFADAGLELVRHLQTARMRSTVSPAIVEKVPGAPPAGCR